MERLRKALKAWVDAARLIWARYREGNPPPSDEFMSGEWMKDHVYRAGTSRNRPEW